MYKVFLVEDEVVVREGIKKNIDWEGNGYDFVGEASDGELALPLIHKLHPDIVITDIKMPFMDGLELSRLIKEQMPEIEIIILSGYAEFEYAQKAINIGVAQFISKPINGEELLKEVGQIAQKLDKKRSEREIQEKYRKEMAENNQLSRRRLFISLVAGGKGTMELLEQAGVLGIELSAVWYNLILFKLWSHDHKYEEYSNTREQIIKIFEDYFEEQGFEVFNRGLEGFAILLKADSSEELDATVSACVEKMEGILTQYKNISYFGGIGSPVNRLSELPGCFENASHAMAHRYLINESKFLSYQKSKNTSANVDDLDFSQVDVKHVDKTRIQSFLKLGDKDETTYFVDDFFDNLGLGALQSNMFRQYICMDAYFCAVEFVESLNHDRSVIEPPVVSGAAMQEIDEIKNYLVKIFKKAMECRENVATDKYSDVVDEVMRYIAQNYADEEINLNSVAAHVNFSPSHFSTVFSQQTGQSFIKYLTDYRINKAKELLRCTNKKSSIVGLEVGYKDSHYFSYLFKKMCGMTPTQYRGDKAEEGENVD